MLKKLMAAVLILTLLAASAAMAESPVDVIMNVGTTQAFSDEAVSAEDLTTILQAGLAAESAINQQPWYFVAVTNQDVINELTGSGAGFGGSAGGSAPEGFPGGAPEGFPGGDAPAAPAGGFGGGSAKAGLGDSPAAIIIYRNDASKSPNADFDCGLATQNMVIAAASLGYGVKIVSSPTMTLNGANHDALCEKLGVDPSMQAVAVLLIGKADNSVDATTGATTREAFDTKVSIIE